MRMSRRSGRAGVLLALALTLGCQPVVITSSSGLPLATATMTVEQMPRISAADLKAHLDRGEPIQLVDTRSAASFAIEHIAGAVNAPYGVEGEDYSQLPKDRFVALYCT